MRAKKKKAIEFARADDNAIWKVEDFASFSNTFNEIGEFELAEFDTLARKFAAPYLCVKMLFGVMPIITPLDADPNMLQAVPKEEVARRLSTTVEQVEFQVEMLKIQWKKHVKQRPEPPAPEPPDAPPVDLNAAPKEVVTTATRSLAVLPDATRVEQCLNVIEAFQFDTSMFDVPGREDKVRLVEIEWFAERLVELKKMFEEPMAKTLARQAMMNEMQLRRADSELSKIPIASTNFWNIHDKKIKLEERYENQWKQLEDICPYVKGAMQKQGVHACISELIRADQEWTANGNKLLADGIFTALELQVLLRASVQMPEPMYRPGWVMAVLDARENLQNPHYKRALPDEYFQVMDDALRQTHALAVERGLIKLIDLEDDSPKGEYPPFHEPTPEQMAEAVHDITPNQIPTAEIDGEIPDIEAELEEEGKK